MLGPTFSTHLQIYFLEIKLQHYVFWVNIMMSVCFYFIVGGHHNVNLWISMSHSWTVMIRPWVCSESLMTTNQNIRNIAFVSTSVIKWAIFIIYNHKYMLKELLLLTREYHQTSNISRALVGNKIVGHSDVHPCSKVTIIFLQCQTVIVKFSMSICNFACGIMRCFCICS